MDGDESQINYEIIEENVNKLSKKVQETNPSILTFLSDPYCLPSFRDPPTGIKEYTKNHLLELLSISLSPDLNIKTIRAFYNFCFNDNPASFKPILENGFFNNVSEVIIQNCINNLKKHKLESYTNEQKYHLDDMSNSVLGRISALTFNSFYNCPKESFESIKFLPGLLYFCYNPSVCSVFEKILSNNGPQFFEIQSWLVNKVKIHLKIAETIFFYESDKISIEDKDLKENVFDDDYSFNTAAMYKLLAYGSVSSTMGDYFRSESCISAITSLINAKDNQRIRDARWYAAICLVHPNTAPKLLPLINDALVILDQPVNCLTGEIANCISFISMMLKYYPIQTAKILLNPSCIILNSIIKIVFQFNSSTALHFIFRSFVMNSIKNSLMMPVIVRCYVPLFIAEIHNKKNHSNNESEINNEKIHNTDQNSESDLNNNDNSNLIKSNNDYQNGLFYITCWSLLIKIDDLSLFSQLLPKKPKKTDSNSNESPKLRRKSSIFTFISSKFQKNQKDIDNENSANQSTINVKISDIRDELFKISGFEQFVRDELIPYMKILDSSYGGPLPIIMIDQSPMFLKS